MIPCINMQLFYSQPQQLLFSGVDVMVAEMA